MEQNQILRSYDLRHVSLNEEQPDVTTSILSMTSYYSGEYGPVVFYCEYELETDLHGYRAGFKQTSGSSELLLQAICKAENSFFMLNIVPLFNPINKIPDEVQRSSPSESQDS